MRFRSLTVSGVTVYAVAGTTTVSFGIDATPQARTGLLGFAVERINQATGERHYMRGFKVFPSTGPGPAPGTDVSTYRYPVQSLVWDDFDVRPGAAYRYLFSPVAGTPSSIDRSRPAVSVDVTTEPLYGCRHDVFFNRGVASSQAYAREFANLPPDEQPSPQRRTAALQWLSRDLDDALLAFVDSAQPGDSLHGCFYEFTYAPVLAALRRAIDRGVDVTLILDMKVNEHTANEKQPDGSVVAVSYESFPRQENLDALQGQPFPADAILFREARTSAIAHNKFLVLSRGDPREPTEVWTGSTNLTQGGIHGQANVGHWMRDAATAAAFLGYWTLLSTDPGGRAGDPPTEVRIKNAAFYDAVATLSPVPARDAIPVGITTVFSPRTGSAPLDTYVGLLTGSRSLSCITFAFSIAALFKSALTANTPAGPLCLLLLESEDRPRAKVKAPFVRLNAKNNVYEAAGSEISTPIGRWVVETDNRKLGLNTHIAFVHCKFLLSEPLGADPIVVTGSANFSAASTNDNDENMVIIRGDRRVADIYFTEFNRIFNHYYFRSVVERTSSRPQPATTPSQSLVEDDTWLEKYRPGTLRSKRVQQYVEMALEA